MYVRSKSEDIRICGDCKNCLSHSGKLNVPKNIRRCKALKKTIQFSGSVDYCKHYTIIKHEKDVIVHQIAA